MSATTIRDFLVSLGFEVDKSSERTFNDSLKSTAQNAAKLGLAIETAAASLTAAVVKMAQGMEKSYYASQRLGASVKDINAVEHAMTQVGGSAEGARSSMESIAAFMRRLPAGKNYIQRLVGSEVDASNVPAVMQALSKKFSGMSFAQAKVQANFIGIDDDTLQAMVRDGGRYFSEYQKLIQKAGIDQDQYAKDSHALMVKVRDLGASFSVLSDKIGIALISKAGPYIEKFKAWIDRNFDSITEVVVKVTDAIMRFAEAISRGIDRVIEWYDKLDPKSKELVKTLAALAGGIWLLNKAFGASPIGIILSLAAALVTLYQDYQRWKETGEDGLVDWEKWGPTLEKVIDTLKTIGGWFVNLASDKDGGIGGLQTAFAVFAGYMATKWAASLLSTFGKVKLGFAALAAYIAYDLMKTPEQRLQAMNDNAAFLDRNVENSTVGKWFGRQSNRVRGWFGMEPTRNEDGSSKGPKKYSYDETGEKRTAPTSANSNDAAGKAVDKAFSLNGMHERRDRYAIQQYLKDGGVNLDPATQAWCAATINSSLAQAGLKGTGSQVANSFQKWGKPVNVSEGEAVKKGDVIIQTRGLRANQTGGHVGFATGRVDEKSGKIEMYSGNTSNKAKTEWVRPGGQNVVRRATESELLVKQNLDNLVKKAASIPKLPAVQNGSAQALGAAAPPLLPNTVTNNSTANMQMKTEINIMGNADANQVQGAVEKAGGSLQRNMQTAIR